MLTDDGSIIYECLNGESEAFGILVDRYKEGIYAYVYAKLRDFHDAQDVTQEVFLQAYRSLRSLRRWESFSFWLYRIASARCKLWVRTQSRRVDQDFIADQDPEVLENLSIDSHRVNQLSESVQEALGSLPETYREALILYYFGGMNSVDIARALGTSPSAIRHRLSRARAQIKEEMVAMTGTAFEGQRLPAGFTFRIVEAVKRIKIHPMPRMAGLPWGLSLAGGIVITVMSLNPYLSIHSPAGIPMSSALPGEMKALKNGKIPVDILKTAQIPARAGKQGNGDVGAPRNASMLAPRQDEGGTWMEKADMPTARAFLSTCEVNGKIYAIGGAIGVNVHTATLEEYDPTTDKWTRKTDMLTLRNGMGAAMVNGKIYVIGGVNADNCTLSVVEEYDPVRDKWTKKANMPTARFGLSASVVNGKIYAIGGDGCDGKTLPTVEEYDPVNDIWEKKTDMPTKRAFLSTSVVSDRIYAIGGGMVQHGIADYDGISVVEEYDPATDTWTKKSDMQTPRVGLITSVLDGKIYAIGGGDRQVPSNVMEVYDPTTDTWAKKPNMPTARGALSASVFNDKIYVIGGVTGWGDPFLTIVEEYDPESTSAVKKSIELDGKLARPWGGTKAD